jgi:hypothetical protein
LRLIAHRPKRDDQVDQRSDRRVGVKIDRMDSDRLDGDVGGESPTLTAEMNLTVWAPAPVPGTPHQ